MYKLIRVRNKIVNKMLPLLYTCIAKIKFRAYNIQYGINLLVDGKIVISTFSGNIKIGNNIKIISRYKSNLIGIVNPTTFQIIGNGRIEIGNNTGFTSSVFSSRCSISIGQNVKIGGNVRIIDHDYHSLYFLHRRSPMTDKQHVKSSPIIIEDDVFIGTNCIILKGVHIGARSIIGAGSVVSIREIPADSLVAGNPATVVKKLGS